MTWANEEHRDERELIRYVLDGKGEEWERLRGRLYSIIDMIASRIQEMSGAEPDTVDASSSVMKDLAGLAMDWARAKVERPSLENDKLRAEIASEFAEAKKRWAEALKAQAEAQKIAQDSRNQQLVAALDNLERLIRLTKVIANVTFEQHGNDGHLLIGPNLDQIGLPAGDNTSLGTSPPSPTEQ